jgi:hypothetical protein
MKKIIFLSLLVSSFTFAQTNGATEQTSSKIKVYSPSSSMKAVSETYKWTVKTDIFSYLSGEFPIIGEYRFAKKLSAEVSAGLTFGLYENFGLFEDGYSGDGSSFSTKAAMGSAFRGGIKFYPSSDYDAIEGWAFGLQLFSRTNNREYTTENYSREYYDLSGEKDSRTKTGLALTISKQIFWDSNISFEYILGIGFASVKHDFLTEISTYDSGSNTTTYFLKPNSNKETIPNFQLGCRIGFGN